MGTQIYAEVTALDSGVSAAVSGSTILLDYRFAPGLQRIAFVGTLTSNGGTVTAKVSPDGGIWYSKAYTTVTFSDVINGPLKYIKFNKTGDNYEAKVVVMCPGRSKPNPTGA